MRRNMVPIVAAIMRARKDCSSFILLPLPTVDQLREVSGDNHLCQKKSQTFQSMTVHSVPHGFH